jgi:hypothetical protein
MFSRRDEAERQVPARIEVDERNGDLSPPTAFDGSKRATLLEKT